MKPAAALLSLLLLGAFDYRDENPLIPLDRAAAEWPTELGHTHDYQALRAYHAAPYGIPDLQSSGVEATARRGAFSFGGGYYRLGLGDYGEHRASVRAAAGGDWFYFKMLCTAYHIVIPQGGRTTLYDGSLLFRIAPEKPLSLSVQQSDVAALFSADAREWISPVSSAGLSLRPFGGCTLSASAALRDQEWYAVYEGSFALNRHIRIAFAYAPEQDTYACSAAASFSAFMVEYTFRNHTVLGTTHHLSLSVGTAAAFPVYRETPQLYHLPSAGRIDIQRCKADELTEIPGVSMELAERVIRYREIFGAVTRSALVQLGFHGEVLNTVLGSISNLAEEPARESRSLHRPLRRAGKEGKITHQRKTDLFERLVAAGIRPLPAMKLTRAAAAVGIKRAMEQAATLGLSHEELTLAARVCGSFR